MLHLVHTRAYTSDWYTQVTGARCCAPRVNLSSRYLCAQFTCFTNTAVQILTCKLQRDTLLRLEEEVLAALARADARLVAAGQVRVLLFAVGSTAGGILQVLPPLCCGLSYPTGPPAVRSTSWKKYKY